MRQVEDSERTHPEPIPVAAPKRKSTAKNGREAKQRKISDYIESSKNPQKRKANAKGPAKKARSSQAECDRQMELMENDDIGCYDLTVDDNSVNMVNAGSISQKSVSVPDNAVQKTVDLLKEFEAPNKKVFKFVDPTKSTEKRMVETFSKKEDDSNEMNLLPQVTEVPRNGKLVASDVCRNVSLETTSYFLEENAITNRPKPTIMHKDTTVSVNCTVVKKTENGVAKNGNRSAYVPSCIKSMFGTQRTSNQIVQNHLRKDLSRKKSINLR